MRCLTQACLLGALGLAMAGSSAAARDHRDRAEIPLDQPRPLPGVRPDAETIAAWKARKFGMFIHFGLYSVAGGMWNGRRIDNGYSEQIMANAPIPVGDYERLAGRFDPTRFDPDAIVALAKAAGMKFIVLTAKHHDGFNLFKTEVTPYNVVDATPYHRDIVRQLADACRRGGLAFGVYYSTIDWHHPGGNRYVGDNSNPITPEQEAFNVAQLKELTTHYGPLSEIWFDMGRPTPEQSAHFADVVHRAQPQTMVSGRVWNHQGDFAVMGDNALPGSRIEEPWQSPASIFGETWGYRAWQQRGDLDGKIRENIYRLVHIVSAGGNYILNIGPEGDGSVVPYEADVLKGIGRWMHVNGEAIYGTERQPFAALDFGYATAKPDRLYLFVRNIPSYGKLRLPGVAGAPFGRARVLGDAAHSVPVQVDGEGAWIDPAALPGLAKGDFLPVVAVDLVRPLVVRPPALAPQGDGIARLGAGDAARFENHNGFGYNDPSRTYKLQWHVALPAGRYRASVKLGAPVTERQVIELVIDSRRYPLTLLPGSADAEVTVSRDAKASPYAMQVAVTPVEPFTRADALPAEIARVDLAPLPG